MRLAKFTWNTFLGNIFPATEINLSDSGFAFSTPKLREEVYALRSKYKKFYEKLKIIPHLELPASGADQSIIDELTHVDEWLSVNIESDHWSEAEVQYFAQSNLIRTLIDFIPDSRYVIDTNSHNRPKELAQYQSDGRLKYFSTDLLDKMPNTSKKIYSFTDYPKRTRLVKIPPRYSVPWHTHHNYKDHHEKPYFFGVIQIPLVSENAMYRVRSTGNSIDKVYEVGQAFLFNAFHFHSVENNSDKERITLFLTIDLEHEPTIQTLLPLVEKYSGPLL